MRSAFIGALALCASTAAFAQEPTVVVEQGLQVWDLTHRETLTLDAGQSMIWSVQLKADEAVAVGANIEKNWASPPSVALCSQEEFNKFRESRQLFTSCESAGTLQSTNGALQVAPGKDGVYYAVVLNGRYAKRTSIETSVKIRRPFERSRMNRWPLALSALDKLLHGAFKDFQFAWKISECGGDENAYYSPRDKSIVLCTPIVDLLERTGAESTDLAATLVFVLLHEVGHGLLDQWNVPGSDNEEMADEMGAVLLLEFSGGDEKLIGGAVRFWQSQAAYSAAHIELLARSADTHAPAIQRARKLATVTENYGYYRPRWASLVYPFLTTPNLEKRARGEGAYPDAKLARTILAARPDSVYYAQSNKGDGAVAIASAPPKVAKWLAGVRDPMRRAEVEAQPFLVALIDDYAAAVGEPTAFRDAINTGAEICLSACRDGKASKVVIGDKITAADFVKMVMSTRYGTTENAVNRWAALERIDAVVATLGADAITLSQEDAAYFAGPFAELVSASKKLSGRAYPNIDRLIARAKAPQH